MTTEYLGQRKGDILIGVMQNNREKCVRILSLNDSGEKLVGFSETELANQSLDIILPPKISEMITDYLEYEDDANDLADVLSRVREFSLRNRKGEIIPLILKITRAEPVEGQPGFTLILRDNRLQQELEQNRRSFFDNMKGHEVIDEISSLPNRTTFLKDLELVSFYVKTRGSRACVGMIQVDGIEAVEEQFGPAGIQAVLTAIGHTCRVTLRQDDTCGALGNHLIGVVILDAGVESAGIVFNRLRWNINSHPVEMGHGKTYTPSVSIGYAEVPADCDLEKILAICEAAMVKAVKRGGNTIQES